MISLSASSPTLISDLDYTFPIGLTSLISPGDQYDSDIIRASDDLENALTAGTVNVVDGGGVNLTTIRNVGLGDVSSGYGEITDGMFGDLTVVNTLSANTIMISGVTASITDSYVTAATLNSTTLELERNEGLADVTVDLVSLIGPLKIINLTSTDDSSTFTRISPKICTWDVETYKDAGFTHSNVTSNTRITVVEDGTYQIAASLRARETTDDRSQTVCKILINGVIQAQPYGSGYIRDSGNSSEYWSCVVNPPPIKLSAGDYVEVQIQGESMISTSFSSQWYGTQSSFSVINLTASKGDAGATGAGSNIIVQKDDVTVGTVTDTLNFSGTGISTVVDEGLNKTTVVIDGGGSGVFGTEYEYDEDEDEEDTNSTTYQTKLTHDTASLPSGDYRIGYYAEYSQDNNSGGCEVEVDVGGTVIAQAGMEPDDERVDFHVMGGFQELNLSGVQTIRIRWRRASYSSSGNAEIRRARIEIWRVI